MVARGTRQALTLALALVAAVSVLRRGPRSFAPPPDPPPVALATSRVDVNHASRESLESLPAVGPTLARRIIEGRPYTRLEDLRRVRGIGARTLARLRDRACVGDGCRSEVPQEAHPDGGRDEVRREVSPHEGERVGHLE
jgi:competence protein ComEA